MAGAATATELESLVVRLLGDASSYMKMMEQSVKATNEAAKRVEDASKRVEGFQKSVEGFGKGLVESMGALGALKLYQEAFAASEKREQSIRRMNAVLKANGREVEATMKSYKEFSKEMNKQTMMTKGQVLQLVKLAETYNLTGDMAKKAVKEVNALAAITDSDPESMMRFTSAMVKGDYETAMMFKRMIPQLRQYRTEAELVAGYQKLVASGLEVVAGDAADTSGRLEKLGQTFKGLLADAGDMIQQGLAPVVAIGEKLREAYDNMSPTLRAALTSFLSFTATMAASIAAGYGAVKVVGLLTTAFSGLAAHIGMSNSALLKWTILLAGVKVGAELLKGASKQLGNTLDDMATGAGIGFLLGGPIGAGVGASVGAVKSLFNKDEKFGISPIAWVLEHPTPKWVIEMGKVLNPGRKIELLNPAAERAYERLYGVTVAEQRANAEHARITEALYSVYGEGDKTDMSRFLENGEYTKEARQIAIWIELGNIEAAKMVERFMNMKIAAGGVEALVKGIKVAFGDMHAPTIDKVFESAASGIGNMFGDKGRLQLGVDIGTLNEELGKSIHTWGMTAGQIKLYELAQRGATDADLAATKAMMDKLDLLEQQKQMAAEAKAIQDATRTPLEKYNAEVFRLRFLVQQGALDWETYKRAVIQAQKALSDTSQTLEAKTYGSAAAIEAVQKHFEPINPAQDPAALLRKSNESLEVLKENTKAAAVVLGNLFGNVENN